MNVYDFDKTIYAGDSTVDFYLYCLRRKPALISCIFTQVGAYLLYTAKKIDTTQFKERFFSFLSGIPDVETQVEVFWDIRQKGIRPWYLERQRQDDVVISASPAFLLSPICRRLGITSLIATEMDPADGRIRGGNCKGKEKVRRFLERYPDGIVERFYSDSRSDAPLAEMAEESILVRGNRFLTWSSL